MTRTKTGLRSLAAVVAAVLVIGQALAGGTAAAPPAGFTDTLVAAVSQPIDLAVVERGSMRGAIYVTSKSGTLSIVSAGASTARQALDLSARTCSDGERGLLGVALDPRFGGGANAIYLFYTASLDGECRNRVSRFTVRANGAVDVASEQVLIQTAKLMATNHNGGDLNFGADGYLYVSIGENGRPSLAQRRNTYFGKILRITTGGAPAGGNPFSIRKGGVACGTAGRAKKTPCAEVFAYGLRNPFQFAFAPGNSAFLINDVGQETWDEIDRGLKGGNYGWPEREGPCPQGQHQPCTPAPAQFVDPIAWYDHETGCDSITAGAFVPANSGWPGEYAGDYLFADFICGKMFALSDPLGAPPPQVLFAEDMGMVVAFQFDPVHPGELLYTNLNGEIRRISLE